MKFNKFYWIPIFCAAMGGVTWGFIHTKISAWWLLIQLIVYFAAFMSYKAKDPTDSQDDKDASNPRAYIPAAICVIVLFIPVILWVISEDKLP